MKCSFLYLMKLAVLVFESLGQTFGCKMYWLGDERAMDKIRIFWDVNSILDT